MGTWSVKPFDNDEAEDFLACLVSDEGASHLATVLKNINLRNLDDEDECSRAIAACEVVAAAAGNPIASLPSEVRSFLRQENFILSPTLHKRAQKVAAAILTSSGLAELWGQSGKANAWQRTLKSLVDRLGKPMKVSGPQRQNTRGKKKLPAINRSATSSVSSEKSEKRANNSNVSKSEKSVSLKEMNTILAKLGGGYAGTLPQSKLHHEVSFATLRKLPGIKDAERMATLPQVDSFTVGGQKLSEEHKRVLRTLIEGWTQLRELIATGTTGGFAEWICHHASKMGALEVLNLDHTDVTDVDLKALQGCLRLRELNLSSTSITTKGLEALTKIESLRKISICNCNEISVADASTFFMKVMGKLDLRFQVCDELLGLKSLKPQRRSSLLKQNSRVISVFEKTKNIWPNRFFGTTFVVAKLPLPVTLPDIASECYVERLVLGSEYTNEVQGMSTDDIKFLLNAWPQLRELQVGKVLDCPSIFNGTLRGLPDLQKLALVETPCDDAVFSGIKALKNLVRIEFNQTNITGEGLRQLSQLPCLRWVALKRNSRLSKAQVDAFRKETVGRVWVDFYS